MHFDATPGHFVKREMDLLLKWYNKNKEKLHPFVLAVIFHHKFEKIHPFMNGNSRAGRMILNYILFRNNYPSVIVHNKSRSEYFSALGKADENNLTEVKKESYSALLEYIANELKASYWSIFL